VKKTWIMSLIHRTPEQLHHLGKSAMVAQLYIYFYHISVIIIK